MSKRTKKKYVAVLVYTRGFKVVMPLGKKRHSYAPLCKMKLGKRAKKTAIKFVFKKLKVRIKKKILSLLKTFSSLILDK